MLGSSFFSGVLASLAAMVVARIVIYVHRRHDLVLVTASVLSSLACLFKNASEFLILKRGLEMLKRLFYCETASPLRVTI